MLLDLSAPQADFFSSEYYIDEQGRSHNKYVGFHSGVRGGKTHVALRKLLHLSYLNSPCNGLVVSAKYSLQRDVIIPEFKELLESLNIPYKLHKSGWRIELPWSTIYFKTANERIVSMSAGYAYIDEAGLCPDICWIDVKARVSDRRAKQPQIIVTGTPEGTHGFFYEDFKAKPIEGSTLFHGTIYDNEKFLGANYIRDFEASLPQKWKEAYVQGEFVDFSSSLCYASFDRKKHVAEEWKYKNYDLMNDLDEARLILCCDFGTLIGAWNLAAVWEFAGKQYVAIIDEIHLEMTNTFYMAQEFVKRFRGKFKKFEIYGDATGGQAGRGDGSISKSFDILTNYFKDDFQTSICAPRRNPFIIDRILNFESALIGGKKFELKIHPRCQHLIEDLNQVKFDKDGSNRPDKKQKLGKLTHHSDAVGYMLMDMNTPISEFNREVRYEEPDDMPPQFMGRQP